VISCVPEAADGVPKTRRADAFAAVIERYQCTAPEGDGAQFAPPSAYAYRLARDPFGQPVPILRITRQEVGNSLKRTERERIGP
jgi:hypothetical protein